jgi:hypothetical protein
MSKLNRTTSPGESDFEAQNADSSLHLIKEIHPSPADRCFSHYNLIDDAEKPSAYPILTSTEPNKRIDDDAFLV